jgi:hypothetical protein
LNKHRRIEKPLAHRAAKSIAAHQLLSGALMVGGIGVLAQLAAVLVAHGALALAAPLATPSR